MEALAALFRVLGLQRADLLGTSLSAPLAVHWAAQRPETVDRLVLYGGWVQGDRIAVRNSASTCSASSSTTGDSARRSSSTSSPRAPTLGSVSRWPCTSVPPRQLTAHRTLAAGYRIDVTKDLPLVTAPTVVIHRKDDRAVPFAEGQRLAAGIPGAILRILPGRAHLPFVGDVDALVDAVRHGLGLTPLSRRFSPSLTPRQREVAALVSEGLSNRQIAERLVITERSAESHVERIRARLGFRSRAQIAAWHATNTA